MGIILPVWVGYIFYWFFFLEGGGGGGGLGWGLGLWGGGRSGWGLGLGVRVVFVVIGFSDTLLIL